MHRPFRFAPPSPGPSVVLRPRLLAVLARRFEVRLVTVEAGAGLGKTTLLAQAMAENRLARAGRDCWVTCEPSDSSPSTLLDALLDALATPSTGGGRPTVASVCEAVWAAAPDEVCIVLDDAHHLETGSGGERVVQRLLDDLPANGHLLVAARRLPELTRSRLLLQGRAVELHEVDLLLDDEETAALAAGRGVPAELLRDAGGWPALVELRAGTGVAHAERFAWEEVVAPLSSAERGAFLRLVALGGVDGDSIEAAVGQPIDRTRLAALPLVSTDDRGGMWPHPLWEHLLRSHLDEIDVAEARRRLAQAMRDRGEHGAAFELLVATGQWDAALAAVFDACNDQRRPPWPDQLERWRRLLPDELADRPEVLYLDAMAARTDPWSSSASDAFAAAVAGFVEKGDIVRQVTAAVRAAHSAWLREDRAGLDAMHALGQDLLALGMPVEPFVILNRATHADIAGDSDTVRELCGRPMALEPRLRHFPGMLRALAALADGDADAAVAPAAEAATAAMPVDPAAGTGWSALLPSLVAWARGDVATVLDAPPVDPGPRQSVAERVPTLMLAAVTAADTGDRARATETLATIDALVPEIGQRALLAGCRAIAGAAVCLADGDEAAAVAALDDALAGRDLSPTGAGRAIRWLPAVPYVLHAGSRAALESLDHGPARRRAVDAARALHAARTGDGWEIPALVDDPDALLAALGPALAVELLARCSAAGATGRAATAVGGLASRAPGATRDALHALAATQPGLARAARALLAAVPIPPPHRIRIEVLGTSRLLRDGEPVDDPAWRRQRVRQLLCALVAHRELRRARLGVLLWPDFDDDGVSANLRMTLSYLQGLLEPHRERGDAPWFLQQDAGVLRLRAGDHLEVDAWELADLLAEADRAGRSGTPSIELDHLLRAVSLWRGEYLADVAGEDWAEPLRAQLQQQFVRAAVRAGDLLVAAGRASEAVAVAGTALEADPWSEAALRLQVTAQLASGDGDAAAGSYRLGMRRLAELGVAPGAATLQLGRQIGVDAGR